MRQEGWVGAGVTSHTPRPRGVDSKRVGPTLKGCVAQLQVSSDSSILYSSNDTVILTNRSVATCELLSDLPSVREASPFQPKHALHERRRLDDRALPNLLQQGWGGMGLLGLGWSMKEWSWMRLNGVGWGGKEWSG